MTLPPTPTTAASSRPRPRRDGNALVIGEHEVASCGQSGPVIPRGGRPSMLTPDITQVGMSEARHRHGSLVVRPIVDHHNLDVAGKRPQAPHQRVSAVTGRYYYRHIHCGHHYNGGVGDLKEPLNNSAQAWMGRVVPFFNVGWSINYLPEHSAILYATMPRLVQSIPNRWHRPRGAAKTNRGARD